MPIAALGIDRQEAVYNCGFRLIQIWQPQDCLSRGATFFSGVLF
jgi:hypothetical protein